MVCFLIIAVYEGWKAMIDNWALILIRQACGSNRRSLAANYVTSVRCGFLTHRMQSWQLFNPMEIAPLTNIRFPSEIRAFIGAFCPVWESGDTPSIFIYTSGHNRKWKISQNDMFSVHSLHWNYYYLAMMFILKFHHCSLETAHSCRCQLLLPQFSPPPQPLSDVLMWFHHLIFRSIAHVSVFHGGLVLRSLLPNLTLEPFADQDCLNDLWVVFKITALYSSYSLLVVE